MKTITIDGKDIEISEESFEELKKQLTAKKFEFKYNPGDTYLIYFTSIVKAANIVIEYKEYGRYRKTKKAAEFSLLISERID